jgi:CelD/BcsL family acetyltransferase involved in cellulose biosynthesis
MIIALMKPGDLTAADRARWVELQQQTIDLASPFFSPHFIHTASVHRPAVELAVLRVDDETVGFLPCERYARTHARPIAAKINDFQGGVFCEQRQFDAARLLRLCRLSSWQFDHLPLQQQWASRGCVLTAESPYVDLSEGFNAYLAGLMARSGSRIKTILRKERKLTREVGPVRLVFHEPDAGVFQTLLKWKSDHLQSTGKRDPFQQPWVRGLFEDLRLSREDECQGVVSALYAGDTLAAAHFGIGSARVLHWWVPTYNPSLERYSPGGILLFRILEHAAKLGLSRVDLGKGSESYKSSFQSAATLLGEGVVRRRNFTRTIDVAVYRLKAAFRGSAFHGLSQRAKRFYDERVSRQQRRV